MVRLYWLFCIALHKLSCSKFKRGACMLMEVLCCLVKHRPSFNLSCVMKGKEEVAQKIAQEIGPFDPLS